MDFKKMLNKLVTGNNAKDFIAYPKKLRNDLRYHPTQDISNYYELQDGQIIAAVVNTEDEERVKAYVAECGEWVTELPSVRVERIFSSDEDARAFYKKVFEAIHADPFSNGHILTNIVTNGELFPNDVNSWKDTISKQLQIPIENLDSTLHSLAQIDKQIKKLKVKINDYYKLLLIPTFGYTGEVIRQYWNGEWFMKQSVDFPAVYEPFIKTQDGKVIVYFLSFCEMVIENYKQFSSYSVADLYTDFYGQSLPTSQHN